MESNLFSKFKDEKENYKEMLGLYEATDLRVHGEEIPDKAHEFIGPRLSPSQPN